jgi:hypothetical protein
MALIPKPLSKLPRPGQKVCWRSPQNARAWGWEDVLGTGPFNVVRIKKHHSMAAGLIVQTKLGEREIPEVWLTLADERGSNREGSDNYDFTTSSLSTDNGTRF